MLGNVRNLGREVRIHRPERLEVAADPAQQIVARLSLGYFDPIVKTCQADAFGH